MNDAAGDDLEARVLVLAPTARDAAATRSLLATVGVACDVCATVEDVCREAARGVGAAVVTAEALLADSAGRLAALLREQPPWSDLPLIALTPPGPESPRLLRALEPVGPMTLMKRPVHASTLVSAVRAALRDRHRQYAVRGHLAEQRRQAESLRASEGRLQLAVEIARMGTFEIDLATDEVTVNEPGRAIYGWDSPRTTFAAVQSHFHPEDRAAALRAVASSFDPAGPGTFEVEQRIVRTDGEVRWIRVRGRALFEGEGGERRAVQCVGTYIDVTDRKRTEAELRNADRQKDDFLALLAHELRNPLAPLRNGLQVIRLSEDMAVRQRAQDMMDRQLAHMVRMIDDLLDVSRITRNKMELRLARITLADAVGSAVETARPVIEAAGHELTVDLPDESILLDADLTRLAQVFANLLTNSAKYTERGGRIELAARRDAGGVVVTVRDTGIGIPAGSLARIFDMFSQVDRSLERSTGGLGIGLALVKGLVEMHGGTVSATSPGQGGGSEFAVRLPVAAASAVAHPGARGFAPGEAPDVKRRVLVVDDNRDAAASMAEMLRLFGHEVALAHDGLEAVERAAEFLPRVILMDVGMPRMNGLEATRLIREQPWARDVVVIALTGWGQAADRERSREAGCDGHLVKPVSLGDLRQLFAGLA